VRAWSRGVVSAGNSATLPRQELRQHRTGLAFCGAEQLRARKRGLRQAYEPTGFLDAVAAAFLPPPLVVRRGDDLACTAIGERHGRGEPDLVAFLVVRDRSPIPAALTPVVALPLNLRHDAFGDIFCP